MLTQNRNSMSNWIRSFTALLLIGLLLSGGPAFAKPQAQATGSTAKHLPANGARSQNQEAATNIVSLSGSNSFQDPSFEAYTPNPHWSEFSTNMGTPLCKVGNCGPTITGTGPHTGSVWAWFGSIDFTDPGVVSPEVAYLRQNVTIPSCGTATLQFYFWIGKANPLSGKDDVFVAKVDGNTVFSADATNAGSYPTYTLVSVDVSPYANGAVHLVEFSSNISGQKVWFNLDDVSLVGSGTGCIFNDVPTTYWANNSIERLYNAGITGGCSLAPLNYCPDSTVTRAQMAVFLLKGIHGSSYTPDPVGTSTGFSDVPVGYWAANWIKQLAAEGITGGCGTGIYCPDATVTRAQMAIFLLKAKYTSTYNPPVAIGSFVDVPVGYWARNWIEQLAVEGITSGCGVGVYCPDTGVTRAQMAVFLVKTFNLP
jgi:hypothetical protein